MFRVSCRAINLLSRALKSNALVFNERIVDSAITCLHNSLISKAFYTDDVKGKTDAKIPLINIIESDKNKDEFEKEDTEESREASWRTMKFTLSLFTVSFSCLGVYLVFELGKPPIGENGAILPDEFTDLPPWQQYIFRTLRELDYYKRLIREPSRDKLLPDVMKYPYYQPPYTLVLEMKDVLVHPEWTYQTGWRFKKRPGTDHFLETLNGSYEIVVYTAEPGTTVFPIIEALDTNNVIAYKLVRDATHFVDGHHVKNLDKLNRDLSRVIVVDWNTESVKFHPENVLHVSQWAGNDDDSTLIDLTAFLGTIAQSNVEDVREVLKYYNQFDNPLSTFREKQRQLMEKHEEENQEKRTGSISKVKQWTPQFIWK